MDSRTHKTAVIGAGQIGRGWAALFAAAGHEVAITDQGAANLDHGLEIVRKMLADLAATGRCADPAAAYARIRRATDIEACMSGATWVQECCPEDEDIKRALFQRMDAAAPPDAILASSCSGIPGSRFLSDLPGRDRAIILHPANPVHAMPIVEIVPCPWHEPAFVQRCRDALSSVGQIPVIVHGEVPGFVMNRLQAAVINEAVSLVGRGIVSPQDLDRVMEASIGLRWAFIGPFQTMDLNAAGGVADYMSKFSKTYAELGSDLRVGDDWTPEAIETVTAACRAHLPTERIEDRQAWRDRTLLEMRQLIDRRRDEDPYE
ncbi:MAG: 3-hydroxyacyl-CoA dehydrogenase [Pseudomonadota bacterium]